MSGPSDRPRTFPPGVPCWVDTEQPDPAAAAAFYAGLFGWQFPDGPAPGAYRVASLDGADVAAIGPAAAGAEPVWNTYLAVSSADDAATLVAGAGGRVVGDPADAGPQGQAGRSATCTDPEGAAFRVWQPGDRPGVQVANVPGAWNFSRLHTRTPAESMAFYAAVFGWLVDDSAAGMIRVAGYGDHLAATVDPDIRRRQAAAPPGFADVVAGLVPAGPGENPHWHVMFTVADRDASAADAERLGGTVLASSADDWTRSALVRDPQGAQFTLSQFAPPGDWT